MEVPIFIFVVNTPNYAIKPIAEQALGINRTISCRNGLLRRWISEAVAGCGRAA